MENVVRTAEAHEQATAPHALKELHYFSIIQTI